ncbi:MAG: hypothetical protein KDE04_19575, partial [Anaerolineales bacterium]|nr:hypothetical protein [Anaerolineales bacterium]
MNVPTWMARLRRTLGTATPLAFLLGLLVITLATDVVTSLLEQLAETTGWSANWVKGIVGLAIFLVTILFFNIPAIMLNWLRNPQPRRGRLRVEADVPQRAGLIVIVSNGTRKAGNLAVAHHAWAVPGSRPQLRYCWLLTGPDEGPNSSKANAEEIEQYYKAQGVIVDVWSIDDVDDIDEVIRKVQTIYENAWNRYQLTPERMIADFTGGTKSMSAGLVLASIQAGVD